MEPDLEDIQAHIKDLYHNTSDRVQETAGYTLNNEHFNDSIVNVTNVRYALDGRAYVIIFFVGQPAKALSQYRGNDSSVGVLYPFSGPFEIHDGSATCDGALQG